MFQELLKCLMLFAYRLNIIHTSTYVNYYIFVHIFWVSSITRLVIFLVILFFTQNSKFQM